MKDARLKELLTLSRWDQLTPAEQEEAVGAVLARLPAPFRFASLETHELGQQHHSVAFFTWNEARFALIPGGLATLGYDPGKPFAPTKAQRESWEETRHRYDYPDLEAYLEQRLTPVRQVTFQPFLLEVTARRLDHHASFKNGYRVYNYPASPLSHSQTQEAVAQDGFRFPTSDEWEYACAAGARTLWRWGDDTPMILMPIQRKSAEWDLHLRPNAFGLLIGNNPANWEFTAEQSIMCGGDSGTALHVEPGRFIEWLTLASSYCMKLRPKAEVYRAYIRRVYSLFG